MQNCSNYAYTQTNIHMYIILVFTIFTYEAGNETKVYNRPNWLVWFMVVYLKKKDWSFLGNNPFKWLLTKSCVGKLVAAADAAALFRGWNNNKLLWNE